ncbi:MAG TPA: hypothetical protein VGV07_14255 [Devosia sp.]|uniref:hypothetical protein n=1 Tax=Devosia sp. TaxID=1871048 RepID=UPI002DDD12E9|nr:hypothetical protein [Devosia sp.]HEV2516414.1 hypothetical protein [Devosia sp.]
MKNNRTAIAAFATLLAMGYGVAEAAQVRLPVRGDQPAATGFVAKPKVVADTCDQSYPSDFTTCDPDSLTQRCDDAGGGMSSLEGGGIDCDLGPE